MVVEPTQPPAISLMVCTSRRVTSNSSLRTAVEPCLMAPMCLHSMIHGSGHTVLVFVIVRLCLCGTGSLTGLLPIPQMISDVLVGWLTLLLRIERSKVQISARRPAIVTEGSCGFPQYLQASAGITPYGRS